MNSLNLQTGYFLDVPLEWLPKPATPKPDASKKSCDELSDEENEPKPSSQNVDDKIKGKSTMSLAKRKAYERMMTTLQREEETLNRERERLRSASVEDEQKRKEDERARQIAAIEDREMRIKERAERKAEREGAALKQRRLAEARAREFKEEQERIMQREIDSKTKKSYMIVGDKRPDGKVRSLTGRVDDLLKPKGFLYYGDFASIGKEKTEELRDKWSVLHLATASDH